MGMIERFRDAQNGREAARDSLVTVVKGGVGRVMPGRLGLAIVIAGQRGDDGAVAPLEPGDVAVQHKVFAVLVMSTMADHVPGIMHERSCFEKNSRLRRKMMYGLEQIEK